MTDQTTDQSSSHVIHDAAEADVTTNIGADVGAAARATAAADAAAAYGAAQGAAAEQGEGGQLADSAAAEEAETLEIIDYDARAAADGRTPGELLAALDAAEAERDEHLDHLLRSQAEFANLRRRAKAERDSAHANGVGFLAGKLLEVLDDFDRTAEVAAASPDAGLAVGISAVHRKLVDTLIAAGLSRIDQADVPFDPTIHDAVQQQPAETPVDGPQVATILRPGYAHNERCLRPAMVVVRQ